MFGLLNEISMLSRAFRANSGSSAVGVGNPHFGFFLCLLYVPSWFVLFFVYIDFFAHCIISLATPRVAPQHFPIRKV